MQFTTAFIVTSFLAFVTGVHSANVAFYENEAYGCTRNDPGDYQIRNVRCNVCIQPSNNDNVGPFRSVHTTDLSPGQRLDVHDGRRCTQSSFVTSGQESQGESWTTIDTKRIRSIFVNCPGQKRTSDEVEVVEFN